MLNSVDHITSYEGKILSEGRLNIANALNYVKTPNQVQNIVVRVSRTSSSPTMTSLGFYITYFKNYQSFAGIVNGSALPSGTSMSYYQTVTNTTQRVLQAYYSGPAITNTGTLFTCRFKTNVNESYSVFADTIYVSNPYNLPYTIAVLGDLNNDGFVDNTDKNTVLKYIAGLTSLTNQQLLAADVDFSGSVDISDATEIAKYAAGIINSFY